MSIWGPIRESKKLFFQESISKAAFTVELNEVGWIHLTQYKGVGGVFGHKLKYANIHLTVEDARNLIKCLEHFVPKSETEKGYKGE